MRRGNGRGIRRFPLAQPDREQDRHRGRQEFALPDQGVRREADLIDGDVSTGGAN